MYRRNLVTAALVCIAAPALLAVGCAAPDVDVGADTAGGPEYPDWVRIVPGPTEEASYYVGTVGLARSVDEAIEAAEADAFDQMRDGQRRHFILLFDRAAKDGGIETTSEERLELRTSITDEIMGDLEPAAERRESYYRHCEGDGGKQRASVCEAFVLLRLNHAKRDSVFAETLAAIGQRKQRDGEANMAALIEWTLRNR